MKRAYIVKFEIRTRVEAESEEQAIEMAISKVVANADQYVIEDNACRPKQDLEMPTEEQVQAIKDAKEYIETKTRELGSIDFTAHAVKYHTGPDEYYADTIYVYQESHIDSLGRVMVGNIGDNGIDEDYFDDAIDDIPEVIIEAIADAIRESIK